MISSFLILLCASNYSFFRFVVLMIRFKTSIRFNYTLCLFLLIWSSIYIFPMIIYFSSALGWTFSLLIEFIGCFIFIMWITYIIRYEEQKQQQTFLIRAKSCKPRRPQKCLSTAKIAVKMVYFSFLFFLRYFCFFFVCLLWLVRSFLHGNFN